MISHELNSSCRPTREQALLLQAVLSDEEEALAAWRQWFDCVDVEREHLDIASFRLLPLVYQNLHGFAPDAPMMGRLKGIYRRSWYENQMLFDTCASVLALFAKAGIPALVLKGVPLALVYYADIGTRPMSDVDILVPEHDAVTAVQLLLAENWTSKTLAPDRLADFVAISHGHEFFNQKQRCVDLHWRLLPNHYDKNLSEKIWRDAVSIKIQEIEVKTLSATDHLMHVCIHGYAWNPVPPVRWIVDALMICRCARIDWQQLLDNALRYELGLELYGCLHYLKHKWRLAVPDNVLETLQSAPVSKAKRLLIESHLKPPPKWLGRWPRIWCSYRCYAQRHGHIGFWPQLMGFPDYARRVLGKENNRQIASWLLKKAGGRIYRGIGRAGTDKTDTGTHAPT